MKKNSTYQSLTSKENVAASFAIIQNCSFLFKTYDFTSLHDFLRQFICHIGMHFFHSLEKRTKHLFLNFKRYGLNHTFTLKMLP